MSPQTNRALPFYAAAAAAVLIVGGGAYGCSKRDNGDRLSDSQVSGNAVTTNTTSVARAPDPARRCASGPTYELLKRELFRRAAQIRGSGDPALFDRIATAAALRVERPLVTSSNEGLGSIACSATASVDLPPGLAVAGGRTSLSADLGFTLEPAADGTGDVLALTNADAIVVPLATIGRSSATPASVAAAGPPSASSATTAPAPVPATPPPVVIHRPQQPPVPTPTAVPSATRPSFACGNARTRGELAICRDPGLASLDRQMSAQYREAYAAASPETRDSLRSTAHRFYGYRDDCPDAACIADGYRERMREIDDLMRNDR